MLPCVASFARIVSAKAAVSFFTPFQYHAVAAAEFHDVFEPGINTEPVANQRHIEQRFPVRLFGHPTFTQFHDAHPAAENGSR